MASAVHHPLSNGHVQWKGFQEKNVHDEPHRDRAHETSELLRAVEDLLIPFIAHADKAHPENTPSNLKQHIPNGSRSTDPDLHIHDSLIDSKQPNGLSNGNHDETPDTIDQDSLIKPLGPHELMERLDLALPEAGLGQQGLTDTIRKVLKYSVNTWHQGFMHKLYATTNPIGVISELVLAVLNTALHVYKVSPALSVIERLTSEKLANAFGFTGPHAGGGTHPGGSASNLAALVIARNTYFPLIRHKGNNGRNLIVFTSNDSHYSITKAAQTCGIGAKNVWKVPTDAHGRMRVDALTDLLREARLQGFEPFFINATLGTTVLGAFDPLHEIADLCEKHDLWMHVDASWGGGAVFSDTHRHKLAGIERARSITTNPHKMLGVPVTCSFLLASDMRVFWQANRFEAGYLFHSPKDKTQNTDPRGNDDDETNDEVSWDLADATLQCGRKGDSLKLALSWIYNGREGLGHYVENGFANATYLASLVQDHPDLILVSTFPPPCLQVCFYHQPDRSGDIETLAAEEVTRHTNEICEGLVTKGFMVDFAPGPHGSFLRVVVNGQTTRETLRRLVNAIVGTAGLIAGTE